MTNDDIGAVGGRGQFPARAGDWMQTFTGRRFWPLDPRAEDVIIEDIAHALSLLTRYGGHCTRFYSVAEHCVHLARAASPENALWLLLHDGSEAYLSDMVRPLKRHMPEYRAAEDRVSWAVYEACRLDPGMEPAEVKALDNRILMDERAQVMTPTGDTWNYGGAAEPLGVVIQFWSPERAEREFLSLYSELTGLAVAMPALSTPPAQAETAGEAIRSVLAEWYSETEGMVRLLDADLPDSAEVYVVGARRSRYQMGTYGDLRRAALAATRHEAQAGAGDGFVRGTGIYMASKTTHAPQWRQLRADGLPIISTWIDEAGKGETACFADLWQRCIDEAATARALIVYMEPGEVLKGAFVEVGAALSCGVPVYAVGCDEFSFTNHIGVTRCASLTDALLAAAPIGTGNGEDA